MRTKTTKIADEGSVRIGGAAIPCTNIEFVAEIPETLDEAMAEVEAEDALGANPWPKRTFAFTPGRRKRRRPRPRRRP